MLLDRDRTSLLIIDMQERLLPAMADAAGAEQKCAILIRTAKLLDVPIAASQQYPKGLGPTVAPLRDEIGNAPVYDKTAFSCWREPALKQHFIEAHERGRPQVVIGGIEAHVCVVQTAIDMAQAGFAVFVVADATSSRAPSSVALALERLRQNKVQVINAEMAVFELLGKAGTAEFKAVSALVR
jgi:nicotinamidase-related amidase